jgi:putative restriction endonuclease
MSYFEVWMRASGLSESSIKKYEGALSGVLSQWAQENGIINSSLTDINNSTEFSSIAAEIEKLSVYQQRNATGHHMYSSALLKYAQYLEGSPSDQVEADIETIISNKEISVTEKSNLIKTRIGQGTFRGKLINYWKGCAVTGCPMVNLLVASHIKPWAASNNAERLDAFNGLLLLPNLDRAFDLGYISFDANGKIQISPKLEYPEIVGVSASMSIAIQDGHQEYLDYHRQFVFNNK